MLESNYNNLRLTGAFDRDQLRRTLAAIHNLSKQGYDKINLDITQMTAAFSPDMLPLAAVCRGNFLEGVETLLELPIDSKLARLFHNCNWAHLIDPRSHAESEYKTHYHLPALTYKDGSALHAVVDRIMELLLRQLDGFSRNQLAALEWAVNEITDNVLNHAESPIGGVAQVTLHKNKGLMELVACDTGTSIPYTLRAAHQSISSDVDALDKAIREGVTRNSQTNMGNGLFGSYQISHLSKGHFGIYSRYATLEYREKKGLQASKTDVPFPGTVVVAGIKVDNPTVLQDALSFGGEMHVPSNSYVDRLTDQQAISLRLIDECQHFGTRQSGAGLKTKLLTLIRSSSSRIIIDLTGVGLISSSFADEVFGKVLAELGPVAFMSRIQIVGGNKVIQQLIDRAMAQRMALIARSS
jgi:anti-sigma regulatory factor (Ser/Thr protein kinase)